MTNDFKSGFVALIGRPNVGKSSLVNTLIGQKITITSDKPQTTRNQLRGITTAPDHQIIWVDTPGLHQPLHQLGERMVRNTQAVFSGTDLILWILDASLGVTDGDRKVAEVIKNTQLPVIVVWNKIDLVGEKPLPSIPGFERNLQVSALNSVGISGLMEAVVAELPNGPQYYPADMVTDHPERFIVAEFIREQVLQYTEEEVPHSVAIQVDRMEERPGNRIYIEAVIYVERDSQKGIIIGAKGERLKTIGSKARENVEELLELPVFLNLWVKVRKKWRNDKTSLKEFGYWEEE